MDNLLTLALEAHSDELNRHRRYEIAVGRDLLEHWTVTVRYGRVGGSVREMRFGSPHAGEVRSIVLDRLRRRLSAPRRIGCAYTLRQFSLDGTLRTEDWIPASVVAQLLSSSGPPMAVVGCR